MPSSKTSKTALFCTTDRVGFFKETGNQHPVLIDRTTKKRVPVGTGTLAGLIEIEIANYTEQFRPDTASEKLIEFMRYMLTSGKNHMTKGARDEFARLLKEH